MSLLEEGAYFFGTKEVKELAAQAERNARKHRRVRVKNWVIEQKNEGVDIPGCHEAPIRIGYDDLNRGINDLRITNRTTVFEVRQILKLGKRLGEKLSIKKPEVTLTS